MRGLAGFVARVLLGLALVLFAADASAVDPATAALNKARSQFQQALSLETAGDWAGALGLLQEVAQVKMTPQVRFNIALCEEHIGRLAIALGDYKLALVEAEGASAQAVAEQVPGKIESLNARIPKVVIKRGPGAEFATISLDGVALGPSSIGSEMPVDPGPHTIEGRAPGFNMFMNSFNIAERELKNVNVTLARIAKPARTESGEYGSDRGVGAAPMKRSIVPYVVGGAGVAVLVAGGVFYVLRTSAISHLDRMCGIDRNSCPSDYKSTEDKAKLYNTMSIVGVGVGVVGIGTGVVLYFTMKPTPASVALTGPDGSLGATLRARF